MSSSAHLIDLKQAARLTGLSIWELKEKIINGELFAIVVFNRHYVRKVDLNALKNEEKHGEK